MTEEELIYDWNAHGTTSPWPVAPPMLIEHTLPAAALTPSATLPGPEQQAQLVKALTGLGIDCFALGTWADGPVQELYRHLLPDLEDGTLRAWVEAGGPRAQPASRLHVYVSPRLPGWTSQVKQLGRRATVVIQDATRVHPETLLEQLRSTVEGGGEAVCLCDDLGRAIPESAGALVRFVSQVCQRLGAPLRIEWSGRNDRSLALANAASAWRAGAGAIHCSFFGLGEGSGLVPTELLLVNLVLLGSLRRDMRGLGEISKKIAQALSIEIYPNLPVVGADAFRTATGVHAAAIVKAHKKGHDWLADLIYSGVPAQKFGFTQIIEIGPMAGASNVQHWLERHQLEAPPDLVQKILAKAKTCEKILSDEDVFEVIRS